MHAEDDRPEAEETSRPQKGGEGGTTRFGMEDGDNTDISTTGGPQAEEEEEGPERRSS
ncbi:MAG TPA: hypothetical protein VNT25_06390 [Allosphingosinicella sp.]|nr:hypothetical protein [Allosphingosinicella sp.]